MLHKDKDNPVCVRAHGCGKGRTRARGEAAGACAMVCSVFATITLSLGLGGCAQQSERGFMHAPGTGGGEGAGGGFVLPRPDGGAWSEAVFDAPLPGAYLAMVGGSGALPEFARRDAALAYGEPGPLLATNQWPVPEQPELGDTRYLWLPSSTSYGVQLIAHRRR